MSESIDRMEDDRDGEFLDAVGLKDSEDSVSAIADITSSPVPIDLMHRLRTKLAVWLPQTSDPSYVLRALQRFIAASRSPTALLALFERDDTALPTLLKMLGAGERLTAWLVADPESFDLVRASDGAPTVCETLVDEILNELEAISAQGANVDAVAEVLWSVYGRERLRIAYSAFVNRVDAAHVGQQLSVLADAIIESATVFVRSELVARYGQPRKPDGRLGRFAVIGLGALGGGELHDDSPLDLMFLRDLCEPTDGGVNLPADEFFDALARGVLDLLGKPYAGNRRGIYDVTSSHGPRTDAGSLALTTTEATRYYHLVGRTWERLLYVKSRCVAGDADLGGDFLSRIQPWIYRRYLEPADIEGLHAIARKIARRIDAALAIPVGSSPASELLIQSPIDVLCHAGGLNDVDAVTGLLQLTNGCENERVRVGETRAAIAALRDCDGLSIQEATRLIEHEALFRQYLHCVQAGGSMAQVAWQMGHTDADRHRDVVELNGAIETALRLNMTTLQSLLADAMRGAPVVAIETELMLDPEPDDSLVHAALLEHRLTDAGRAMRDLQRLADEPVPFLSSRRCRHAIASIAPPLMREIGRTPDPHATLAALGDVTDSLGGKAVLWDLFGVAPPTMRLVVRLCACAPYLVDILIKNPGMIDELIDSLRLDRLPTERWLEASSIELCRTASDIEWVMAGFKAASHLQIGVRDVLGKEPLEATHQALAATAESTVRRFADDAARGLAERFGDPVDQDGNPIECVILGMAKLGGREPNYLSDLDVAFLYTADGNTRRRVGGHRLTTTAAHFYGELARQVLTLVRGGVDGEPLYPIVSSLTLSSAPSPDSASPSAVSIDALRAHFRRGEATLGQRMALCKARPISGSPLNRKRVVAAIAESLATTEWYPSMATKLREMRIAMESDAADENLKRAPGGSVDVEWIAQTYQLRHAAQFPQWIGLGTTDVLQRIGDADLIDPVLSTALIANYRMLREVESKLCLLQSPARHEIPDDERSELLAFLMDQPSGNEIQNRCRESRAANRRIFNQVFDRLAR